MSNENNRTANDHEVPAANQNGRPENKEQGKFIPAVGNVYHIHLPPPSPKKPPGGFSVRMVLVTLLIAVLAGWTNDIISGQQAMCFVERCIDDAIAMYNWVTCKIETAT